MPSMRSSPWGVLIGLLGGASVMACDERDRLVFPTPSDGVGPVTTIDQPNGIDTTIFAGPHFFVNGRTIDPDGVDTVYFLVMGGSQNFSPFHPSPVTDTVTFGLPVATLGHVGQTLTVQIYGVDALGNRGNASTRQLHVR